MRPPEEIRFVVEGGVRVRDDRGAVALPDL
jgi:hypothetical protein